MDREINQYKIVVPLLVQHVLQHVLHQLKAQQFYAIFFPDTNVFVISEVEF